MTISISVIIATRDRQHLLQEALKSLAAQRFTDFEVIIVNDGGTSIREIVSQWHDCLTIVQIELDHGRGLAAARNLGIAQSRGELLAFLDDDDIYRETHLQSCFAALTAADADLVYTDCLVSDRRLSPATPPIRSPESQVFDLPYDPNFLLVCNFIPVISVVCKNFKHSGARFDETLPNQEDWDMWLQLQCAHRYRFLHHPEVTTIYRRIPGPDSMTGAAGMTALALAAFDEVYDRLIQRWTAIGDARIGTCRELIRRYQHMCIDALTHGRVVCHFRYENVIHIVRAVFDGNVGVDDAIRSMEAVLFGTTRR